MQHHLTHWDTAKPADTLPEHSWCKEYAVKKEWTWSWWYAPEATYNNLLSVSSAAWLWLWEWLDLGCPATILYTVQACMYPCLKKLLSAQHGCLKSKPMVLMCANEITDTKSTHECAVSWHHILQPRVWEFAELQPTDWSLPGYFLGIPCNLTWSRWWNVTSRVLITAKNTQLKKGAHNSWSASILARTALLLFGFSGYTFVSRKEYHKWPATQTQSLDALNHDHDNY